MTPRRARRVVFAASSLLVLPLAAVAARAADWPGWRGPNRDAASCYDLRLAKAARALGR